MDDEDKIYKPDPGKFGNDKATYERMCLMYERCGVTEKMMEDGKNMIELERTNPAAYNKVMIERHGKDWNKSDDSNMPQHAVCTDYVNNIWETVGGTRSYKFEKGGDGNER
ncbi:MAG: hypothetical protein M0Z50_09330 [Planctomycetia bacterium]|nr:hypothetical protein [Planctomycetia bacterium]